MNTKNTESPVLKSLKSDVAKRFMTHGSVIRKLLKNGVDAQDAQEKLVRTVVWKIFGFAEACIIELSGGLIGVELYDVVQYAIEVIEAGGKIAKELDEARCKTAANLKLRYYVCTDGMRWALYEVDVESGETYRQIAAFDVHSIERASDEAVDSALSFASERHCREAVTDASNRKRWYGYWNKNKTEAECLFLVEYVLYVDSSEMAHIPLLNLTLWGNAPFEARSKAWEKIRAYATEHFKGKISGSFETIAYKKENKSLKKKVRMTRDSNVSVQGELFA